MKRVTEAFENSYGGNEAKKISAGKYSTLYDVKICEGANKTNILFISI